MKPQSPDDVKKTNLDRYEGLHEIPSGRGGLRRYFKRRLARNVRHRVRAEIAEELRNLGTTFDTTFDDWERISEEEETAEEWAWWDAYLDRLYGNDEYDWLGWEAP